MRWYSWCAGQLVYARQQSDSTVALLEATMPRDNLAASSNRCLAARETFSRAAKLALFPSQKARWDILPC
jgi:hypothetical protein